MSAAKPYESESHLGIRQLLEEQIAYVHDTLRDDQDGDKFARLSPDQLSMCLMELTGMYESLSKWLADEKLHIADLKAAVDLKTANEFLKAKRLHDTNEVAKMKARVECADDVAELDTYKHGYDVIEAWRKTIGRYHDACRSQLSYEKSMYGMSRGTA